MKPVAFDYARPERLSSAFREIEAARQECKLMGGGQSLGPMLNLRLARPDRLIDVSAARELRECSEAADSIEIGAAVTHSEIEDGRTPDPASGFLRHVAAGIAYRAVRNRGTIGGSLCHADPAADWISATTALAAGIVVENGRGRTRTVAMPDFMVGAYTTVLEPGEIVRTVRIPKYSPQVRWGYYKICRKVGEFADAIGAVVIDPQKRYCRVVCGATGGAPLVMEQVSLDLARSARSPGLEAIKGELGAIGIPADEIKMHQLAVAAARSIERALGHE